MTLCLERDTVISYHPNTTGEKMNTFTDLDAAHTHAAQALHEMGWRADGFEWVSPEGTRGRLVYYPLFVDGRAVGEQIRGVGMQLRDGGYRKVLGDCPAECKTF